ncbi:MAG: recombinase family protein [Burkholderiaceae bacterium]
MLMERPALKPPDSRHQIGKVDIVVVYKIDRLSRSLADFARMVDVFDPTTGSASAPSRSRSIRPRRWAG